MNIEQLLPRTLAARLRLTTALGLLALFAVLVLAITRTRTALETERLRVTHETVAQAVAIVTKAHQLEQGGQLPRDKAQALALAEIAQLVHDDPIWVAGEQLKTIGHPRREWLGKSLAEVVAGGDPAFEPGVAQALRQGASGEVGHAGPASANGQRSVQRSVVQAFAPWGWVVGSADDLDDLIERSRNDLFAAGAAALLLSALAMAAVERLARDMQCRLARTADVIRAIARGKLGTAVDAASRDEVGRLQGQVGTMQAQLSQLVQQIRSASDGIGAASSEIAAGNADLEQRTQLTAGSLQATSASMGQLTATVAHTADSASQANELACEAVGVARRGGAVVARVVTTMEQINERSRRIADITGVIDGIAFQTNILALNAAVEAARAGEQGHGFAVVATEVRSLAQNSADAARQIKHLILASVEKTGAGARLVAEAGRTMGEIDLAVQQVSQIVGQIRNTTGEQSAGIAHINTAVAELEKVTQNNTALVQQSAAATASLTQQAGRLARVVGAFSVAA